MRVTSHGRRRLLWATASGALASVALASLALLFSSPLAVEVAMSLGQAAGILTLSLYLFATALDGAGGD